SPAVPEECPERTDWCTAKGWAHHQPPLMCSAFLNPIAAVPEPQAREDLINRGASNLSMRQFHSAAEIRTLLEVERTSGEAAGCTGPTRLTQCGHSPDRIPQCIDLRAIGCVDGAGTTSKSASSPHESAP